MSLAMSLNNHHGIVMSADKMLTSSYNDSDDKLVTIDLPPTEQKLFLIENKYGLSYTGTASINGIPISALLEKYFSDNIMGELNPNDWLLNLANHFKSQLSEKENIVFIMCGYYNNQQFVIYTNTLSPNISICNNNPKIIYSGESEFLECIINSKVIKYEYSKFTMQDSIDFLCFLNRTVADMMYFGQYLPTVSRNCDILAIYPTKSHWVQHETLKISHWDT